MSGEQQRFYGTGRRKSSVARVYLTPGGSGIEVNRRELNDYFGEHSAWSMVVKQPLAALGIEGQFGIRVTVRGGGNSGQAGAIRLGIARALLQYDEAEDGSRALASLAQPPVKEGAADAEVEDDEGGTDTGEPLTPRSWRRRLRSKGYVTRDARRVERKKVGLPKARKAKQFSKR